MMESGGSKTAVKLHSLLVLSGTPVNWKGLVYQLKVLWLLSHVQGHSFRKAGQRPLPAQGV